MKSGRKQIGLVKDAFSGSSPRKMGQNDLKGNSKELWAPSGRPVYLCKMQNLREQSRKRETSREQNTCRKFQ